MQERTPQFLAWAAGLFEGEGCFHAAARPGTNKITLKVTIAMSDADVIDRFAAIVGFGVHGPRWSRPEEKPMFEWRVQNFERVQALIAMLWPWLGERRRARAIEVLRIARSHGWLKNYCKRGHLRTEANTRQETDWRGGAPVRRCLDCRSETDAARYRRSKEA
jgi:hypothetical protein